MEFVVIVDHLFGFGVVPNVLNATHVAVDIEGNEIVVIRLQDWHVSLFSFRD